MQGLLEFRNTPRENGMSPAEMVFGSQLRSILPAHRTSFAPRWKDIMNARDRQHALGDEVKSATTNGHARFHHWPSDVTSESKIPILCYGIEPDKLSVSGNTGHIE
jgi:hypothetical protein